jgi:hypothetical protein
VQNPARGTTHYTYNGDKVESVKTGYVSDTDFFSETTYTVLSRIFESGCKMGVWKS